MASSLDLVIFDCDGVLVDSEPIFSQVHAEILSECGYKITPEILGERFCGISDAEMLAAIEREWGKSLPADYRDRVAAVADASCEAMLTAFPGIHATLDQMPAPICVASSGTPERIRKSLGLTGLLGCFEPMFSARPWSRAGNRLPICFCSPRGRWAPTRRAASSSRTAFPGLERRYPPAWPNRLLRRQPLPGGA